MEEDIEFTYFRGSKIYEGIIYKNYDIKCEHDYVRVEIELYMCSNMIYRGTTICVNRVGIPKFRIFLYSNELFWDSNMIKYLKGSTIVKHKDKIYDWKTVTLNASVDAIVYNLETLPWDIDVLMIRYDINPMILVRIAKNPELKSKLIYCIKKASNKL